MASEGCVYSLKFYTLRQPEKAGTVSPLSDTGTTHVTLVAVPCSQLSYISYVFKHCDLLVSEIYDIARSLVQSKAKHYIQNKIFSLSSWLLKG